MLFTLLDSYTVSVRLSIITWLWGIVAHFFVQYNKNKKGEIFFPNALLKELQMVFMCYTYNQKYRNILFLNLSPLIPDEEGGYIAPKLVPGNFISILILFNLEFHFFSASSLI